MIAFKIASKIYKTKIRLSSKSFKTRNSNKSQMIADETAAAIGCRSKKDLETPRECSLCDYIDYFGTLKEHEKLHTELNKNSKAGKKSRHKVQSCPFGEYITNSGNLANHMSKKHSSFKYES